MVKNVIAPGRLERPSPASSSSSSQRGGVVRRRRDDSARLAYYNSARYIHRNNLTALTTQSGPGGGGTSPRSNVEIHQRVPPGQFISPEYSGFVNFPGSSSTTGSGLAASRFVQQQESQAETSWLTTSMTTSLSASYTLPIHPPNSPRSVKHGATSPGNDSSDLSPEMLDTQFQFQQYQTVTPTLSSYDVDAGSNSARFGSIDSMNISTTHTVASSISDGYVYPTATQFVSPGSIHLPDLALPEEYFQARFDLELSPASASPTSPLYPEVLSLDTEYNLINWRSNLHSTGNDQYTTAPTNHQPLQAHNQYTEESQLLSFSPWNSQYIQGSPSRVEPEAGCVTFEPPPGIPYGVFMAGEQFLENRQHHEEPFGSEGLSPLGSEEWQVISTYPNSNVQSHDSPHSPASPWSHVGTPPPTSSMSTPEQPETHSHVFSAYPGDMGPKLPRGRQRQLTPQEKKEALDVRKAKACWACHLSKIKCSPCFPGSPCQQCERLSGKRRFCWLPCFNDPLESLQSFLAPEYLFGDFTQAKVEWFVSQNATAWGTHEMMVQMHWGYTKPLEAKVVTVSLRQDSKLGYVHQVLNAGTEMQMITTQKSPPVGIPLASMGDMQDRYSSLVNDIVKNDSKEYVSIAYDDQTWDLPERLLQAVSNFYSAGLAMGDECEPLRQVLEMHVTSTILDRCLLLDDQSMFQIQNHLQESFPDNAAPRCAQRQIKLAFFEVQKIRIYKVLESWGNMMWTANKHTPIEKKWTSSFSILVALTLVMDKTLADAYWTCENRIQNQGADAKKERAEFKQLARLTQTELFERCKEIFHCSFKTRKGGKEACNPIRDGIRAFRGKSTNEAKVVNEGISKFVLELESIMQEFGPRIKAHKASRSDDGDELPYNNGGRLVSIFLADFLEN